MALIENMAREDLNPVEEARACAALVEELGLTREEVGLRVGRSRVAVSNLIRLLDLPDEALDADRARRAHRGPRPRAADWPTTTPIAAKLAQASRRRPLVGARARGARAGRRWRPSAAPPPRGPRQRALHPDQEAAIEQIADALGEALGADVDGRAGAAAATAPSSASPRSTRLSTWPADCASAQLPEAARPPDNATPPRSGPRRRGARIHRGSGAKRAHSTQGD